MSTAKPPSWVSCDASIVVPRRCEDVVENELDGEAMLWDHRTGKTHRLNQTAFAVWQRCDGQTTTREMAEHLSSTYEVDFDTVLDDVEQLVLLLADSNLLERTAVPCTGSLEHKRTGMPETNHRMRTANAEN
jgi:hypothetical protein